MRLTFPRFSLPLLAKELVEQAARKRTYTLRTIYAVMLFTLSLLIIYGFFSDAGDNPLHVLGRGYELFYMLVVLQFAGIYTFLPAMMTGSITREKERDSLVLLMLTTLRPWEIILQKYLSGLLPMAMFLMLSLPVMAVAYSLGGLESQAIIAAGLTIGVTCLQVAAMSLMLSAWCRSTPAAFIMFYVLSVGVLAASAMAGGILIEAFKLHLFEAWVWSLFPPLVYLRYGVGGMRGITPMLSDLVWHLAPAGVSVLVYLALARFFLVRRALVPPRNMLLATFRWLDNFYTRANRVTGGVTLWTSRESLPEDKPIAWREIDRRGLGKLHHRLRVLMLFQIPVILMATITFALGESGEGLSGLLLFIWPIVVLILAVMGANVFNVERSRQTLDVMLTMPLTSREIIQQKMAGIRRVVFTLMIPFLTIYLCQGYLRWGMEGHYYNYRQDHALLYLVSSLLTLGIYLPLAVWLSVLIGLVTRSQTRGIVAAVALLFTWTAGVPMLLGILQGLLHFYHDEYVWMFLISPATIIVFTEIGELHAFDYPALAVLMNAVFHGSILLLLRWHILTNADRLLGRVASVHEDTAGLETA